MLNKRRRMMSSWVVSTVFSNNVLGFLYIKRKIAVGLIVFAVVV